VCEEFVTKTAASASEADERPELGSPTTAGRSVTIVNRGRALTPGSVRHYAFCVLKVKKEIPAQLCFASVAAG
jgi:hypothetical protein